MKLLKVLLLNKQARLFDTKEFLIKAFVAVLLAEFIGKSIPYIANDMISVLFGMVMTLEPVNLTGVKNGFKQVQATIIGAIVTGVVLYFLGYTIVATAISVVLTLYISLLINWKEFSAVAVFTSIYMTQYVQLDVLGNPSQVETFKLRIAALLVGVFIAFFVNWLFSIFGYRHMLEKRVLHLIDSLHSRMMKLRDLLEVDAYEDLDGLMISYPELFNNIDWIKGSANDLIKDPLVKRSHLKIKKLEKIIAMTKLLREMTHINYEFCYRVSKGNNDMKVEAFQSDYSRLTDMIGVIKENMENIIGNHNIFDDEMQWHPTMEVVTLEQLYQNIYRLKELIHHY